MTVAELAFTVETPMFLGGAAPGAAEFRIPSLRGAMRFWFRALAGLVFGDDTKTIATAEGEIFGTVSGRGRASSVSLRPVEVPPPLALPKKAVQPSWLGDRHGVAYLLGPGLFAAPDAITRRNLAPETRGRFALAAPSPADAEIAAICLWTLSAYGGLGSRVRRGFGGIRFTGLEELCGTLDGATPSDDIGSAVFSRFTEVVRDRFSDLPRRRGSDAGYPRSPSFLRWTCRVSPPRPGWTAWEKVLDEVGKALRASRATVDRTQPPRNREFPGQPFREKVTPEYTEIVFPDLPGASRPSSASFELAAFGLPIVFAHGATVKLMTPGQELRRASPLWIRPWRYPNGWGVVYHIFESELWPVDAKLELSIDGKRQPVKLTLTEQAAYAKLSNWLTSAP